MPGGSKKKARRRTQQRNDQNNSKNKNTSNTSFSSNASLLSLLSTPNPSQAEVGFMSQLSPTVVNLNHKFDAILNTEAEDFFNFTTTQQSSTPGDIDESKVTFDMILKIYEINKCMMGKMASIEKLHEHKFNEITTGMKNLKDEINEIAKSQEYLNEKFEKQAKEITNIQSKIKTITNENKKKDEHIDQLKERLRKFDEKLKENHCKMNELEQYGRREMFNVFGIPRKDNENTDEIILDLADKLGFDINLDDIEVTHRTSSKPTAPIIIKFNSRR